MKESRLKEILDKIDRYYGSLSPEQLEKRAEIANQMYDKFLKDAVAIPGRFTVEVEVVKQMPNFAGHEVLVNRHIKKTTLVVGTYEPLSSNFTKNHYEMLSYTVKHQIASPEQEGIKVSSEGIKAA